MEQYVSCIAWDGKILAADRRAMVGGTIRTITKIFRVGEDLLAYAGSADLGEEMVAWYTNGRDPEKFPLSQRDKDNFVDLLVVKPDGWLWKYEKTPYPVKFPPQQFAIGSGHDFAMAAMHLGQTAQQAVEVACLFDANCGNGVDYF
jgi:hypothetical protein